jgi:hypothetical protein
MPSSTVNKAIGRVARRVPGLKRLPVLRLLALGEVALLAQDHLNRLTPPQRRRLVELVRIGRGRRQNLTPREREELSALIARAAPREFAAHAAQKLSPVPIPGPLVDRIGRPKR